MVTALIISGIVLLWYCAKELRNSEPNWPKAFNAAFFWPLPVLFNLFSNKRTKE